MKVICISGKEHRGKDTFASLLKPVIETNNKKAVIIHYADAVKNLATVGFGWDGQKDEKGRRLLQWLGTDLGRKNRPNCWVTIVQELVYAMGDAIDYVLIPDCRFPNEIEMMKEHFDTLSIRVERPTYVSNLSMEAQHHISETALDNYEFDVTIINDGSMEDLQKTAESFYKDTLVQG